MTAGIADTAGSALIAAVRRLRAAGVPHPARDARRLLDHHAPGWSPGDAMRDAAGFDAAVGRRAARQPVSQIVGRRAFWRHDFAVTPDVLDPRPETETLVEAALEGPFERVLDLGTGSGCILVSLLGERQTATGLGTDRSDAALAVARSNAAAFGVADRAAFRRADWFDGIEGRYDLIVSNPPYVAEAEMADLAPEVRDWEPRDALTPGGDGLGAYRAIARDAARHLDPGGRLMVEIGPTQGEAVTSLLRAGGLRDVAVRSDLDRRPRIVIGAFTLEN